jgi:hypothetical protein
MTDIDLPPLPRIIPGDQPVYYFKDGSIVLEGEFSRPISVDCQSCGHTVAFKLIADDILDDEFCDLILDAHLRELGWSPEIGNDLCPDCAGRASDD